MKSVVKDSKLGFTTSLNVALAVGLVAFIAEVSLEYKCTFLILLTRNEVKPDQQEKIVSLVHAVYVSEYVCVVLTNLVVWWFAVKYWVVSKKVQMFQDEINFETQQRTYSLILFGGSAFFTLITTLATIPEFAVTKKQKDDLSQIKQSWTYVLGSEILVLVCSIIFLMDGFYRMKRAIQKD